MSIARHARKRRLNERMAEYRERGKTRRGAIHTVINPPGSKLLKAAYRARHGSKPTGDSKEGITPLQEARAWYAKLVEPKFRAGENERRKAVLK